MKDFDQTGAGEPSPNAEKRTASAPSSGEWLVNVAGDVVVPMTTSGVIGGLRAGRLSERSLVWRIGMHDWTALFDVPQLRLAAGAEPAPPASGRVVAHLAPLKAQAEARRRQDTLPFGFPAVRDDGARYSSSLAPMARDTTTTVEPRALGMWGDRSVVLASEYRAVKATSKRRVLWAALGSAAIASVLTLRLVHWPAHPFGYSDASLHVAETTTFRATPIAPPAPAPAADTSMDAVARPIASQVAPLVTTDVSAPMDAPPKPVAQPRRKKTPAATTSAALSQTEVASAPSASAPSSGAPSAVPGAPAVSARPAAPP